MEFIICFAFIVVLIRFKVPVGVTLVLTAILLSILEFGFSYDTIVPFIKTLSAPRTWKLIAIILLVITLGNILSRTGYLERMVKALNAYISPRSVARIAPALIGLLPMPGGAMVSAPIVEELARGTSVSPETKTAANYWWRHIWEPVWPLYQSVILAAAILGVTVWRVAIICFPITIACIIAGLVVIRLPLPKTTSHKEGLGHFLKEMAVSLWPVLFIVVAGIIFRVELLISVILLYVIMLIARITNFRMIYDGFKSEFSFDVILIFLGGLSLMDIIEGGQAAAKTLAALQAWGIPIDLVVFTLPFLVGLLTGLTAAYVGVGFPIVSSALVMTGGLNSGILLAYAGGLMGIMVSPVHLCFVLTKRYFKAGFKGLYRILIPVVVLASILVFIVKYLFYPN
jgi:integral membrane protein (TIGR00529 family)